MPKNRLRDWVRSTEHASPEEQWVLFCFLAGQSVTVDAAELHAALRRSELLLAAGGDPRRPLELYGRAVTALADDLDDPSLRAELAAGLVALQPELEGLRGATEASAPARPGRRSGLAVLRHVTPRRASRRRGVQADRR